MGMSRSTEIFINKTTQDSELLNWKTTGDRRGVAYLETDPAAADRAAARLEGWRQEDERQAKIAARQQLHQDVVTYMTESGSGGYLLAPGEDINTVAHTEALRATREADPTQQAVVAEAAGSLLLERAVA